MKNKVVFLLVVVCVLLSSCRKDEMIFLSDSSIVSIPQSLEKYSGFYLLNEGNMGMNRASIDEFTYETGIYTRDIFSENNPSITKELGDVGNDIMIYGNKVYATINVSNFIEVFDVKSGRHIKQIHVPNCRYLNFNDGKVYVSSYAGKVAHDPNSEVGFVAEIDTLSLGITRKVDVGYQPEQMVIRNNKLYVANSGGYRAPNYDTTVSVVDLTSFAEIKKIEVGINLHYMKIDSRGDIYVSSRGNDDQIPPNLFVIDSTTDEVKQELGIPIINMSIVDDQLYYFFKAKDVALVNSQVYYGLLDTKSKQIISTNIIKDGTDKQILKPYGLGINPETKEIFITDAQDHVGTGFVYCYSADGKLKWKTTAGNIPAHIAFIKK